MSNNEDNQSGQSLLELMIAMGIFIVVIASTMFLTLDAQMANQSGGQRTRAAALAQEGIEASKSLAARGWKYLTVGTHGVSAATNVWQYNGTVDSMGIFSRTVTVAGVNRDVSGTIVTSGGTLDPDTKFVTSRVAWSPQPNRPSEVVVNSYFTNWKSRRWAQTLQSEFDAGTKNQVVTTAAAGGEVVLGQSQTSVFYDFTFDTPTDYTYDTNKIEVASSQASLINQSPPVSGDTTNPGLDTTQIPWQYVDWSQGGTDVNVTGTRVTSGGNPGAYASLNIPRGRNSQVGGYFQQSFTVTAASLDIANVSFDFSTTAFNGTPTTLQAYVFVDNASGAPTIGTEVWSSGPITGTSGWNSFGPIDILSKLPAAGTYYLKLAVWVEIGGTRAGAFAVGYDNALLHWEKTGTPSYPADKPTINPKISFSSTDISAWQSFTETAVKNGGEIYYQLSDDNGSTWQYWSGSAWATAGAGNYNTAADINAHFTAFPVTAQQLSFRAFLSSDGTQLVSLDNVRVTYLVSGASGYFLAGDFISSAYNTGSHETVGNYLTWTAAVPAGTKIFFQVRSAATQAALASAAWVGPNGTPASYFDTAGQTLPDFTYAQWWQYRAFFTSPGTDTPVLSDVTINYEP
ncbi:MAG: prepilin-type N-terminal cleavage/methylation domain-containing protein [Patescibacteria group bacterium]